MTTTCAVDVPADQAHEALRRITQLDATSDTFAQDVHRIAHGALEQADRRTAAARANAAVADLVEWLEDDPDNLVLLRHHAPDVVQGLEKMLARRTRRPIPGPHDDLWGADPNCDHVVFGASGGGVKCSKCPGWMCL